MAYFRTSSAANVGTDKDSLRRQELAVTSYAKAAGLEIVDRFHDAAVSGADPVDQRPGFSALLDRLASNGVKVVLVEDASRFARDLVVQITGHGRLKAMGVELVAANAPDHFREDTPTAVLIRQVLGAVAQFEKAQLVAKLQAARRRKMAAGGFGGGRYRPVPEAVVREAQRLARRNPKTGRKRSLREVSAGLAELGMVGPAGKPYGAESVKRMLTGGRGEA